jgi:diketogulonate reductase-like aldo/keto reductase
MARFDTRMMAWGPLGQGSDDLLKSPVLAAIGEQYGKTPAQVALRWLIERGIVAIPKSMHKERMAANFDIFDFSLTEADMKAIEPLNQKDTGFRDFADPNYLRRILGMFDLK